MQKIKNTIINYLESSDDKIKAIQDIRNFLAEISEIKQPIDNVMWVDIDLVEPNDYNPNSVAKIEMNLLYKSIKHDGYTQPVVTIFDPEKKKYVIVDGFHRYFVCKNQKDISERNKGKLPIVVIKKDINERMSATIRHNRARGEHSVQGMSNMVFKMLENGWSDAMICDNLGMDAEELIKLKHITGFSKLFKDVQYKKEWKTKNMILLEKKHKQTSNEKL